MSTDGTSEEYRFGMRPSEPLSPAERALIAAEVKRIEALRDRDRWRARAGLNEIYLDLTRKERDKAVKRAEWAEARLAQVDRAIGSLISGLSPGRARRPEPAVTCPEGCTPDPREPAVCDQCRGRITPLLPRERPQEDT